ncbi:MAG: PorT family protein [Bacteroidales bacterium]|nr:PorT family protein [Bacteroidales bacterium]
MKSKLLLVIIISVAINCVFPVSSNSQVLISLLLGDKLNTGEIEFGLTGGYNRSSLIGLENSTGLNNFNLGFYFDFLLKSNWYLYTGVLVKSRVGASGIPVYSLEDPDLDSSFVDGEVIRKLNYFYVPVMIKYKFENNLYVNLGFQAGLRSKAIDEFRNTIYKKDDLVFKNDVGEQYKRIDAGLSAGIGYKFPNGPGVNLGVRYYYGLVNINKEGDDKTFNSSLNIFAEIPIGVNKKEK